jgi:hypothetical protein
MRTTKRQTQNSFSESKATKYLEWLFFFGCGTKHLGWDFGVWEHLEGGGLKLTKSPGPRVWSVPEDRIERIRWNPVWLHLKGCPRGVCRGQGERLLPFVSVDLDRHDGRIQTKGHYEAVMATSRLLKRDYGFLSWLVEVNPKNGSTKFFGFTGCPIPVDYANRLGQQLHESLIANGVGNREVFPHNSPQVFLPMREGKATIIDTGVLGMAERRRDNRRGIREKFLTYSMIAFVEWLRRGRSFDEATLQKTLISACLQLPDQAKAPSPRCVTAPSTPTRKPIKTVSTPDTLRDEPDSFVRQREALLEFCRRNRRVVSVEEGVEFIKANGLFTGSWEVRRAKRKVRIGQILSFIAKTFDGSLCTGVRHEINFGKFDGWAKQHCPDGWRRQASRWLDEYGTAHTRQRSRTVADWQFVSLFLSIAEYIVLHDKNEDDSVPSARAESLWTLLHEQGVISIPFCARKWKITRDRLEKLGVLKIDHHFHKGQAMRWWLGKCFPGLWRKIKKKAKGLLESVPLAEFLLGQKERDIHNSLLQQGIQNFDNSNLFWASGRDPPTFSDYQTTNQTTETVEWGRNKLASTEMLCLLTEKKSQPSVIRPSR